MAAGSFVLWIADENNNLIDPPNPPPAAGAPAPSPDLSNPNAVSIYFGVPQGATQTQPRDQSELMEKIQKALRTITILYPPSSAQHQKRFRGYYVRLFRLGQLGLQGAEVSTDLADAALETTIADLIDDEAGHVKERHLKRLGVNALVADSVAGVLYVLLCLTNAYLPPLDSFLLKLHVQSALLASFMLLLMGSFLGVWLSYAIRTTTFTLTDLTITDTDRLTPAIRLLYAGSLTVILGMLFVLPLVTFEVGGFPITHIASYPMLAFIVGVFCGISELTLPTAVAKRASDFVQNIK
ncbi:MAG TPA: hypothetical protein VJS12_02705 [Steroidobacteraceae bacterium]|nr:hypothetical protein [Steroidobacteraceae bacterium]